MLRSHRKLKLSRPKDLLFASIQALTNGLLTYQRQRQPDVKLCVPARSATQDIGPDRKDLSV